MKVMKFGGSSVGTADSIRKVVKIIDSAASEENQRIAVVSSALQGITNMLTELAQFASENDESFRSILMEIEAKHFDAVKSLMDIKNQSSVLAELKKMINELEDLIHGVFLLKELSLRTMDLVLSFGERLSCTLISHYAIQEGLKTSFLDARTLIRTDARFGRARVDKKVSYDSIRSYFETHDEIPVITGFVASTDKGVTTTLGRGGSDYTAALIGAALKADVIEIWTDVDGVMTTDPRQVKSAFSLSEMTYEEAMEMSHFGTKVIYPPTLQPAFQEKIPLVIKNTFNPKFPGTVIHSEAGDSAYMVTGVSSISEISLVNLEGSGMVGVAGVSSRLFGALASHHINVILITQASSEHSICFAIRPEDTDVAKATIAKEFQIEIQAGKVEEPRIDENMAIVAIIGENMRKIPGISGKMFAALGKNGINVVAIAQGSSERNLSVVISNEDLRKALNTIHQVFFLSDVKTLNVFIVGTGLIGSTLLKQINKQYNYLEKEKMLRINVAGLVNSDQMFLDREGISLDRWQEILKSGEYSDIGKFVDQMCAMNASNSIFVDCTASEEVVGLYETALDNSISITTPNKIAASGDFETFKKLEKKASEHGIKFLFETNVGAGLPVITTLNDLLVSGDKILKIEGVLSGTLSYIFNNFTGKKLFSEVVKEARELGYTEPDPRDDLNGLDVARKILILARRVGERMDLSDVEVENILPETCINAPDVKAFFKALEQSDEHFEQMRERAESKGKVLRFIAGLEDGQAKVALKAVDKESPFYSLDGSDNMITFVTDRYLDRPLVIKGPGAGAEVTAAGVFAEIISLGHFLS